MSWRVARDPQVAVGVAAFALAAALAFELARPFRAGAVAFDSAAAVLYFERLVAGRQLESFVTTLPKPLLTVVYGLLHASTSDWRPISWAAILAFAVGVGLSTVLAYRRSLERLGEVFETMPLTLISPADVAAFARQALEKRARRDPALAEFLTRDAQPQRSGGAWQRR